MDSFLELSYKSFSVELGFRYVVNLIAAFILIRLIYYRNHKRADTILTFYAFNTIIFFISYVLNKIEISVGSAVGLFAIFSMLRYRTESLLTRDMTYLFICLAIGLLCAISSCNLLEIITLCAIIITITFIIENSSSSTKEISKIINYDNIHLIKAGEEAGLLHDLKSRTGLNVTRFEITQIDFLKDSSTIIIYYLPETGK